MTKASKMEYYEEIRNRYKKSDKDEKGTILDEFCKVCGYNRKYAIRKLSRKTLKKQRSGLKIRRPKIYYSKSNRGLHIACMESNKPNMFEAIKGIIGRMVKVLSRRERI